MLRVNLLGKKKKPVPFGLDKVLEKAGVTSSQLEELRPSGKKIAVILVAMYLAGAIPDYWLQMQVDELQARYNEVNAQAETFRKELGGLKAVRQKMETLQKEESEVDKQLLTIQALSQNRDLAFRSLNSVLELLPQTAWIDNFRYKDRLFTIEGAAWEYFTVNDFVRALSENTRFSAVTLRGIKADAIQGVPVAGIPSVDQKTKSFQLEFMVNNLVEAAPEQKPAAGRN
ncbi:MAG: PilN domain-containing protein [Bdellovibrionales bacterium]|nr:PilN domain-containing protein [Bdellovibrionales bacterium]